ncbi:MAG TPA: TMEM175 family protein [Acidobacteriaceae bacterium]|jgi:uncharacterized membrane protein
MYSKHRLEALSDGIFAIAMTLLVLELKVPGHVAQGELGHVLKQDSHAWVSFVVTFAIASVFWTLQHRVFDAVEGYGPQTMVPTFFFLGLVSVLPFSTSLWGQHLGEPLAFFLYFLNQFAIAAALTIKLELARSYGHLHPGADIRILRFRLWTMVISMGAAALGAWFLPSRYMGIAPALCGAVLGRIRRHLARKYAAQAKTLAAPQTR